MLTTWQTIAGGAVIALPLAFFIKYSFIYLSNRSFDKFQTKMVTEVVDRHGPDIASKVADVIASRIAVVRTEEEEKHSGHRGTKGVKETRGKDSKESHSDW